MVPSRNGSDQSTRSTTNTAQLSDDELYQALASETRRRLVFYLLEEKSCSVDTAATVLAGWDAEHSGSITSAADRERIIITLAHQHLPKLEDAGVLTFDRQEKQIRIASLDPLLSALISKSVTDDT